MASLLYGIEGAPTIATPNQSEAERLLNRALITRSNWVEAVRQIKTMGPKYVVFSLELPRRGGSVRSRSRRSYTAPSRSTEPNRRGRPLAAAIVWSLDRGESFEDALRWGVAAGTASAKLPGINLASMEQVLEIHPQVTFAQNH